jgi:hypothetical protein
MAGVFFGVLASTGSARPVEQAIVLAQLLIVRDLERRTTAISERSDQ